MVYSKEEGLMDNDIFGIYDGSFDLDGDGELDAVEFDFMMEEYEKDGSGSSLEEDDSYLFDDEDEAEDDEDVWTDEEEDDDSWEDSDDDDWDDESDDY